MWSIDDLLITIALIAIAYAITAAFVRIFWPRQAQYDDIYPMGDATETPEMRSHTRRSNWKPRP